MRFARIGGGACRLAAAGVAAFLLSGPAPARAQSQPDTAALTPGAARDAVAAVAGGLACAGVTVAETGKGLRVGGYVATGEDAATLKAALVALPGGIDVDARVALRPWPLCEALGVAAQAEPAGALELALNRPSMVYRKDDRLEVTVTAATAGHLTVDYIDGDGSVIHMVPMRLRRDGRLEPGRPVTLGVAGSAGDRVYTVSPPYGPAMILALVTREPLFPADREEVEPAGPYLASLRAALTKAEGRGAIIRSAVFVTVAE
ncbi:DUF4384 domain-containing protein [Azospirillum sp. 412522]|nr:DUF4384 domain-containing protein [Azospirillum sp. 412522]MBY6263174.1 DUF4384 domain-containing protein [Azospirillum sp. 412522]